MIKETRRKVAAVVAALGIGVGGAVWATSAASAAPSAATPKCTPGNLAVWVNVQTGDGAAGTVRYHLDFTNMSSHTCHLLGYPGVSALNVAGRQMGSPASRDPAVSANVINIAPGRTAHAVFGWVDAAISPGCHPATASTLRVIPPNDFGSLVTFFDQQVCTTKSPVDLTIRRMQPGV